MAEKRIITVEVETKDKGKSLAALRKQYKQLNSQLDDLIPGTEEFARKQLQIAEAGSQIKNLKDEYKLLEREAGAAANSIAELEAEQKRLNAQIKQFDIDSEAYAEAEGKLRGINERLSELRDAQRGAASFTAKIGAQFKQSFQDVAANSVNALGNALGIQGLAGQLTAARKAFTTLSTTAKGTFSVIRAGIAATGIGALLLAFGSLLAFVQRTEKGANAFKVVLAAIGAITTSIANGFATLGEAAFDAFAEPEKALKAFFRFLRDQFTVRIEALGTIFGDLGRLIKAAFDPTKSVKQELENLLNTVSEFVTGIDDFAKKAKGAADALKDQVDAATQAERQQQALQKAIRQSQSDLARLNGEVERNQILSEDQSLTLEQQEEALRKANKAQVEAASIQADIARRRLKIFQLENQGITLSIEKNNELAQLQADVVEAEANAENARQRLATERFNRESENRRELADLRKGEVEVELENLIAIADNENNSIQERQEALRKALKVSSTFRQEDLANLRENVLEEQKFRNETNSTFLAQETSLRTQLNALEKESADKVLQSRIRTLQAKTQAENASLNDRIALINLETELEVAELEKRKKAAKGDAELEKQLAEEIKETKAAAERQITGIRQAEGEKRKDAAVDEAEAEKQQKRQAVQASANAFGSIAELAFGSQQRASEQRQQETQAEIQELQKRRQGATKEEQKRIDAQIKAKEAQVKQEEKIKKDAAEKQKAVDLGQAIVSGALAVANAIASPPFFPANLPIVIATTAAQAAQIATISSQQFSRGGIAQMQDGGVLSGPSHAQGGIPAVVGRRTPVELEGGEAIINKRSTSRFRPVLSAINQAGGGRAFEKGGVVPKFQAGGLPSLRVQTPDGGLNVLRGEIRRLGTEIAQMQPVVSVVEIEDVSRRVAVREAENTL